MNAHEDWLREDWLLARQRGIGGSDAAAIMGLSKWKTPLDVYLDKRGEAAPFQDNESMLWGRALEPVIRQQYAERTGRAVHVPDGMLIHPKHDFILANLDGVTDDGRVLEIKTARTGQDWGEPGTDEVPQAYLLQVQHYMAVTGFVVADVAVLVGGSDFRIYEVPADTELQTLIVEQETEFWTRVLTGNPPPPVSYADAVARFRKHTPGETVTATAEVQDAIAALINAQSCIKVAKAEEEQAKAFIAAFMGPAEILVNLDGNTLATWKTAKPAKSIDAKALQEGYPDIYHLYLKPGEASRRFLVK
jgi:putative phage-type endonuclease